MKLVILILAITTAKCAINSTDVIHYHFYYSQSSASANHQGITYTYAQHPKANDCRMDETKDAHGRKRLFTGYCTSANDCRGKRECTGWDHGHQKSKCKAPKGGDMCYA